MLPETVVLLNTFFKTSIEHISHKAPHFRPMSTYPNHIYVCVSKISVSVIVTFNFCLFFFFLFTFSLFLGSGVVFRFWIFSQVGNLGLLFFLLFFIFAALGVELFGRLECSEENPCQGLGEHAHFANFGMAFLTLFRVATGDNWNGIMKDTLRDNCDDAADCVRNCCVSSVIAPIFFVIFVLMAQFVLVNVVVAVLMKHLEESHKQMEDEMDMETELEREFQQEQEFEEEQALCLQLQKEESLIQKRPLAKILSLPSNFTYSTPVFESKFNTQQRRQTLHIVNQSSPIRSVGERSSMMYDEKNSIPELGEHSFNECEMEQFNAGSRGSCDSRIGLRGIRRVGGAAAARRKFTKEMSLDEGASRRRHSRNQVKRMSCDNLSWNIERTSGTGYTRHKFREFENSPMPPSPEVEEEKNANTTDSSREALNTIKGAGEPKYIAAMIPVPKPEQLALPSANNGANGGNGIGVNSKTSFLLVPKLQPRNRSGSCKQLFKQKALDEDQEIDENSLLLPTATVHHHQLLPSDSAAHQQQDYWEEKELITLKPIDKFDNIRKSDSCEILRIISERRMLEKRDNSESNENIDYNQLIAVNRPSSPAPSTSSLKSGQIK